MAHDGAPQVLVNRLRRFSDAGAACACIDATLALLLDNDANQARFVQLQGVEKACHPAPCLLLSGGRPSWQGRVRVRGQCCRALYACLGPGLSASVHAPCEACARSWVTQMSASCLHAFHPLKDTAWLRVLCDAQLGFVRGPFSKLLAAVTRVHLCTRRPMACRMICDHAALKNPSVKVLQRDNFPAHHWDIAFLCSFRRRHGGKARGVVECRCVSC